MMSKVKLTVDDVIAVLQKTNVPTLISEGKGDVIVLRRLEDKLSHHGVITLAADGKDKVLEIFDRKSEINNDQPIMFFVDQDIWIHGKIPYNFVDDNLFYTDGYSIENDMFRDGEIINFFTKDELTVFQNDLNKFLIWYSVALERHLNESTAPIATNPSIILDSDKSIVDLLDLSDGESCPSKDINDLSENFHKLLRGKSLFSIALRQLNKKGRTVRYSNYALLEAGVVREGYYFNRIVDWVDRRINIINENPLD